MYGPYIALASPRGGRALSRGGILSSCGYPGSPGARCAYGYTWLYMAVSGYIWLYMIICMVICGYTYSLYIAYIWLTYSLHIAYM